MKSLLFFLFVTAAWAQPVTQVRVVGVAPTGDCGASTTIYETIVTGALTNCQNGTWTTISSGGASGITGLVGTAGGTAVGPTVTFAVGFSATGTPNVTRSGNTMTFNFPAFTANLPLIGGGASAAPTTGTRSGNTTAFVTTTGTQTSGDCVKIDANGNHVANGSACGSGGGGAVYTLTGLLDTVYTSTTVLTVANSCAAAPATCQVRFGNTSTQIPASGTCTISAGTGTMFEYIATDGRVKCGSNGLTLVCSAGCDVTTSITAFPATSIPLYSWTATSGTWDVSGSSDWRAVLSTKNIACGTNTTCVDSGGLTTISASGGGATIPSVTNVIKGDGAGNGADTKVAITSPTTAGNLTFGTDNATLTLQGTGTVVNRDSTDTLTNKTFGQTVLPSTDSIYNLGSGSFYWAGVYSLNGNFFTSFAKGYQIYGQQFTASGCSNGTLVGGSTAGSYLSGTSGTCTVTVTMGGSQTATTQWACHASNVTTTSNVMVMTTSNTTTATFSGVTVSGDKIVWSCLGF